MSGVTCHMSNVICCVLSVTCHLLLMLAATATDPPQNGKNLKITRGMSIGGCTYITSYCLRGSKYDHL